MVQEVEIPVDYDRNGTTSDLGGVYYVFDVAQVLSEASSSHNFVWLVVNFENYEESMNLLLAQVMKEVKASRVGYRKPT